jgi:hypothetical protein
MAFNYFKDPKAVFLIVFAVIFLTVAWIYGPEFWYIWLGMAAALIVLFYTMRNNL